MRVEKRETIYLEYREEKTVTEFNNLLYALMHEVTDGELKELLVDIKNFVDELMEYMKGDY